jgi:diguanylate cyclase (GGDEF)-like protein/PAS domain S-box-containing protein
MVDGSTEGPEPAQPPPPWAASGAIWPQLIDDDAFGWIIVDQEGIIRYYNDAVTTLLGRVGNGAVGTSIFDHVAAPDLEMALAALVELAESDTEMATVGLPMVFNVLHADGTVMPVEVGAQAYLDDPGSQLVRLRIRDYKRDHRLHTYLETLAQGAEIPELLQAAVRLADATLTGGATAIAHDWDGETYRSWVSDTIPPQLLDALRRADGPDLPWLRTRDGDHHIVSSEDLGGPVGAAAAAAGFGSCWAEPITIVGDPEPCAALVILRPWSHRPLVGHLAAAQRLRSTLALAFLAQRARDRLLVAATTDPLTGLDNRSAAFERLEAELGCGPTGVLYVDLDGFKAINDSRGHGVGDDVLVEVAQVLRSCVDDRCTTARIGGDEFLLVVPGAPTLEELTKLADHVVSSLCQPFSADGRPVDIGATVGVARYPDHAGDPDGLVEAADKALYRGKRAGGRGWAVAYSELI